MWQVDTHTHKPTTLNTSHPEAQLPVSGDISYEIKAGGKQTLDFLRNSKTPQTSVAGQEISHRMNIRDCSGQYSFSFFTALSTTSYCTVYQINPMFAHKIWQRRWKKLLLDQPFISLAVADLFTSTTRHISTPLVTI